MILHKKVHLFYSTFFNFALNKKNKMSTKVKKSNYGIWTEMSKEVNKAFGDNSGRTVSRRTTHGFKKTLKLSDHNISDENAEHIVHGAMISSAVLLANKNKGAKITGLVIFVGLIGLYHAGK